MKSPKKNLKEDKLRKAFSGKVPIIQIPSKATPAIKYEIYALSCLSVANAERCRDAIGLLIDEVVDEYKKNRDEYVNTKPAIILYAFRSLPLPITIRFLAEE